MVVWKFISVWQAQVWVYFSVELLKSLLCRRTYQESVFTGHCKLFSIENLYYWQTQMSQQGTGDTKILLAVIIAVIQHKISSYQSIKWHGTTLKYYGLARQIWPVKSQFCNKFYAAKSLWSCRIYCKITMKVIIVNYAQMSHFKFNARNAYISHNTSVHLHFAS